MLVDAHRILRLVGFARFPLGVDVTDDFPDEGRGALAASLAFVALDVNFHTAFGRNGDCEFLLVHGSVLPVADGHVNRIGLVLGFFHQHEIARLHFVSDLLIDVVTHQALAHFLTQRP